MIFFIALIIVAVLYFLQTDGLIYVTIIALIGELINLLMIHTMTKSIEKKEKTKSRQIIEKFQKKIRENKKTIQDLEKVRDESLRKLFAANKKIQEYEEQLKGTEPEETGNGEKHHPVEETSVEPAAEPDRKPDSGPVKKQDKTKESGKNFGDLPSGSNRKKLPL